MNKKQTAVEWLISRWIKLQKDGEKMSWQQIIDITKLALEMEREQIEDAFNKGYDDHEYNNTEVKFGADPDVYYTQTYGTF